MLPEPYRLHHQSDFSRTVRRGHRIGRRYFVVYALDRTSIEAAGDESGIPLFGSPNPRFGLIINKSVGNAVVRHRVARRLRHVYAKYREQVRDGIDIVVRALPAAATATSADFARDLGSALRKLQVVDAGERA